MNNYILNSGSFIYNNKTYNYIETNNHYNFPYVFKTDLKTDPTIYVKQMSTYGSGQGVGGSFSPDGTNTFGPLIISYEIKAYGVATTEEAAIIGKTTGGNNKCIIKSQVNEYGCKIKEGAIYDTDNRCIKYDDLVSIIPSKYECVYKLDALTDIQLGYNAGSKNIYRFQDPDWVEEQYYEPLANPLSFTIEHTNPNGNGIGYFYQDGDEGGTIFQYITKLTCTVLVYNNANTNQPYKISVTWNINGSGGNSSIISVYMEQGPLNIDTFYAADYHKDYTYTFTNATESGVPVKITIKL